MMRERGIRELKASGIDGYSGLVTYIRCSNNNCTVRALTILHYFLEAVAEFGILHLYRVRSNQGVEKR